MTVPRQGLGGRHLRSPIAASSPLFSVGHMWYACTRPLPERRTATRSRGTAPNGAIIKTKGGASRRLPDHKRETASLARRGLGIPSGLGRKHLTHRLHTPAPDATQPENAFFRTRSILPPAAPGLTMNGTLRKQASRVPEGPAETPPPGDAPALNSTRWMNAHEPAARPAGRNPAARSSAARCERQLGKGRCRTLTACSP